MKYTFYGIKYHFYRFWKEVIIWKTKSIPQWQTLCTAECFFYSVLSFQLSTPTTQTSIIWQVAWQTCTSWIVIKFTIGETVTVSLPHTRAVSIPLNESEKINKQASNFTLRGEMKNLRYNDVPQDEQQGCQTGIYIAVFQWWQINCFLYDTQYIIIFYEFSYLQQAFCGCCALTTKALASGIQFFFTHMAWPSWVTALSAAVIFRMAPTG